MRNEPTTFGLSDRDLYRNCDLQCLHSRHPPRAPGTKLKPILKVDASENGYFLRTDRMRRSLIE